MEGIKKWLVLLIVTFAVGMAFSACADSYIYFPEDAYLLEGEAFVFRVEDSPNVDYEYKSLHMEFLLEEMNSESKKAYTFDFSRSDDLSYSVLLPAGDYSYEVTDEKGEMQYIKDLYAPKDEWSRLRWISVVRLAKDVKLIGVPDELLVHETFNPGLPSAPEWGWVHYGDGGGCSLGSAAGNIHPHEYSSPGTYTVWAMGKFDGQWYGTEKKKVVVKVTTEEVKIPENMGFTVPSVMMAGKKYLFPASADLTGIKPELDFYTDGKYIGSGGGDTKSGNSAVLNGVASPGKYTMKIHLYPDNGVRRISGDNREYVYDVVFTGIADEKAEDGRKHYYYYYGEKGKPVIGWQKVPLFQLPGTETSEELADCYFQPDGKMVVDQLKNIDGYWYYFDLSGRKIAGKAFYYDDEIYYFDDDGKMKTDFLYKDQDGIYYFGSDGKRVYGWQKIQDRIYYFDIFSGKAYTNGAYNLTKDGENNYYYFNADGIMQTDLLIKHAIYSGSKDENYFYYGSDGKRISGWKTINGARYYFNIYDGAATGTKTIDDVTYTFSDEGKLLETVIPVTGVNLDTEHIVLTVGDTITLTATVVPENATNKKVSWSSNNTDIVKVDDNGKVTAAGGGAAYIQVTTEYGNFMAECRAVVRPETPESRIQSFVKRCYELILNREADEGGLTGWSDALIGKTATAAQIIDGFVRSDEFTKRNLSDDAKVDILYRTMLNREADAGGKAGWVDALSKGYTLQNIIDGFCGSAEFTAMCKDYGIEPGSVGAAAPTDTSTPRGKIEAFVKRCYQLILNRQADDGGLKGWSDALEGKTAAAAQIIDGFVRSPEYINRSLTSDQSVTILYKTMLDRDPDEAGKAGWVDALSKGYTLQHIINGFCGSAEFTKICSDYGIQAGSVAVSAKVAATLEAAAQLEAQKLPDERIGNAVSADDAGITVVNGYEPAEVEAFVKHAYRAALGREADEAGLAGWTEQIVSGAAAPKAFLRTLLGSNEFAARNLSSEALVETLYRLYLNRGMDDAAAERVEQLAAGGLDEVIKGFEGSAEFRLVLNGFGL